MRFEIEPTITKSYLLSLNSQETYLEYYLGIPVKKGMFKSPLRPDDTPTCSFYKNKSGDIIFKDFRGDFYGGFIEVVKYQYNCNYHTALEIIANDFGYIKKSNLPKNTKPISISNTEFKESGTAKIQIDPKPFSTKELEWWNQYGITENILKKFRVYSCNIVFLNDNYLTESSDKDFIFGYYRGKNEDKLELWRIYFPFRKKYRFLSNWNSILLQGAKQLPEAGDTLVITKSLKDVMCFYSLGITAIAPNSESLFLTDSQFKKLSKRFKRIVLFYDNDLAGIYNMKKIRKTFNIECTFIPRKYEAKDISDFHRKYGRQETLNLINEYDRSRRKAEEKT